MADKHDIYQNPLNTRYASEDMQAVFSDNKKFSTWRKLWLALAKAEKELGIDISDEALKQMSEHLYDIDYEKAGLYEKQLRHDVMAHIKAFSDVAPAASGIIHLGATSAYVGDNADIIIYREALQLIKKRLINLIDALSRFAFKTKGIPTLAYTHLQPAQPTTVGKRACMWLTDLLLDLEELDFAIGSMRLRGAKGATGTQASFLELFHGDGAKITLLNKKIVEEMGFNNDFPLTSQTYPRKLDSRVLNALSSIAQSLHKFATDFRILQSSKELEEPFSEMQIGSSAMPYKRNPMKAERVCSLSRLIISLAQNPAYTASLQWLERTLDDSANRRVSIPEAFLAADAILNISWEIAEGVEINEKVIEANLLRELPFMAEENILMFAVEKGGNRQELHERLRRHSIAASYAIKKEGSPNPLLSLIASDPAFMLSESELKDKLDPALYTGRAEALTEEFLSGPVKAALDENKGLIGASQYSKV